MRLSDLAIIVGLKYIVLKSSAIVKAKYSLPVGSPLEQRVNAQLLVEEGNGKPPHHHPSSHFPSLDVTSVPPLVSSRTCLTAEHLSSSYALKSSANNLLATIGSKTFGKSFIKIKNNKGPSTLP